MNHTALALILTCFLMTSCASTPKTEMTREEKVKMFVDMGISNLNEGDATNSLIYLKQAEELSPKSPEIQYLLALTYHRKDEIKLAERSAKRAVELSPKFSAAKNTLGKIYLDQGKLNESERLLKEAAQDLTYREAYIAKTNLGYLYRKKKNDTQAEYWLGKAIFEAGDAACMASYFRGQIYYDQKQFEKANSEFIRASKKICSQFSDAHLAQGKTLMRLKKYDQARAKLLEVQQLFPSSDAANLANEYLREIP